MERKIAARTANVGIIGMGYVGLPLALLFSEQKFPVTGFDIDKKKVDVLEAGGSYIYRIMPTEIQGARAHGFTATSDYARIEDMDAIIICVPTPLNEYHEPDLTLHHRYRRSRRAALEGRAVSHPGEHHLSRHHRRGADPDSGARQ